MRLVDAIPTLGFSRPSDQTPQFNFGREPAAHLRVAYVDVRYDVTVDGKVIGAVSLPERAEGEIVARLHPLPAFRVVREVRRQLRAVTRAFVADLTEAELAGEESALSALGQLEFRLVDARTGVAVPNASVRLLPREPPRVRIRFWGPEDASDHPDPDG